MKITRMLFLSGVVLLGSVGLNGASAKVVNSRGSIIKTGNIRLTHKIRSADIQLRKNGKIFEGESMVMINVTRTFSNVEKLEYRAKAKTKKGSKIADLLKHNFDASVPLCVVYRIRKSRKSQAKSCTVPPSLNKCKQRKVYDVELISLTINPATNRSSVLIHYEYYSCSGRGENKNRREPGVTRGPQGDRTTVATDKDRITSILLIVIPIATGGIVISLFILAVCCYLARCKNTRKSLNENSAIHTISSYVTSDVQPPVQYENMPVDSNDKSLEGPLGKDGTNVYATISKATKGTSGRGMTPEIASPTFTSPPLSSMIMQIQQANASCTYERIVDNGYEAGKPFSLATNATESEYEVMTGQHPGYEVVGHIHPIRKSASAELWNASSPRRSIQYASLYFGEKVRTGSLDDVMERGSPTCNRPRGASYCNVRSYSLEGEDGNLEGIYLTPIRQVQYYNIGNEGLGSTDNTSLGTDWRSHNLGTSNWNNS